MRARNEARVMNKINIFSRSMPSTVALLVMLLILSVGTGILSVALINHQAINSSAQSIMAGGVLTGLLIIFLPTLLTVVMVRSIKRYMKTKHILLIAMIGALSYCIFIGLSSAVYVITGNYTLANAIVLVGDASIFAWWFFVSKVVLGQRKKAVGFSLIQPIINLFIYTAASSFIFTFSLPFGLLLIKLAAGMIIFLIVSYMILYLFERPIKKSLGFSGVDAFSGIVQNWLFDIDVSLTKPFGGTGVGKKVDVGTQTVVFRNKQAIKAIVFVPQLHYGPVGTIGGSHFPYMLEKYSVAKYNATTLVMHPATNEDNNPASSSQFGKVRQAFDRSVAQSAKTSGKRKVSYSIGRFNDSAVSLIGMGGISLATFTRAPRITEDISPESASLFNILLHERGTTPILIDAHNSRFESATAAELAGVMPGTIYTDEYERAIKAMKLQCSSGKLLLGAAHIDLYGALGEPVDLAPGNLNVLVFRMNGFKKAIIQFNANNMLPNLRDAILKHVSKRYNIDAEVYTTDTHYVNSLQRNASNVLGRHTTFGQIVGSIDNAMDLALSNIEPVEAYYKEDVAKDFFVWGPEVRERALGVLNDVISVAKVLVPVIIVGGFIAASWIIAWV